MNKKRLALVALMFLTSLAGAGCARSGVDSDTVIVAASDSGPNFGADFISNGVDDQVKIQAALSTGKKVRLLKGTFRTSEEILLSSNTTLEGMGVGVTKILGSGKGKHYRLIRNSDTTNGNSNIVISNMTLDGRWTTPKFKFFI